MKRQLSSTTNLKKWKAIEQDQSEVPPQALKASSTYAFETKPQRIQWTKLKDKFRDTQC